MQTAGRGPNETVSLDKLTVEAESASGSGGGALAGAGAAVPKLRATVRSTMPAQRQPGPLACTPQDGSAAAPGSVVRRRSHLTDDLLSSRIARRFRKRCRGRFHRRPVPPRSATA